LEGLRAKIEKYFKKRTDVNKSDIVNFGNNVKLVTEVNEKKGWILFYCDPE
jgi:hypothetical protein